MDTEEFMKELGLTQEAARQAVDSLYMHHKELGLGYRDNRLQIPSVRQGADPAHW